MVTIYSELWKWEVKAMEDLEKTQWISHQWKMDCGLKNCTRSSGCIQCHTWPAQWEFHIPWISVSFQCTMHAILIWCSRMVENQLFCFQLMSTFPNEINDFFRKSLDFLDPSPGDLSYRRKSMRWAFCFFQNKN